MAFSASSFAKRHNRLKNGARSRIMLGGNKRVKEQPSPLLQSEETSDVEIVNLKDRRMVLASSKPTPVKASLDERFSDGLIARE